MSRDWDEANRQRWLAQSEYLRRYRSREETRRQQEWQRQRDMMDGLGLYLGSSLPVGNKRRGSHASSDLDSGGFGPTSPFYRDDPSRIAAHTETIIRKAGYTVPDSQLAAAAMAAHLEAIAIGVVVDSELGLWKGRAAIVTADGKAYRPQEAVAPGNPAVGSATVALNGTSGPTGASPMAVAGTLSSGTDPYLGPYTGPPDFTGLPGSANDPHKLYLAAEDVHQQRLILAGRAQQIWQGYSQTSGVGRFVSAMSAYGASARSQALERQELELRAAAQQAEQQQQGPGGISL